jgi:hypothetical protein
VALDGWPQRFPAEARRLAAYAHSRNPHQECIGRFPACTFGADAPARYAVWGDSHGTEVAYGLAPLAKRHGTSVQQYTFNSCAPVSNRFDRGVGRDCQAFRRRVFDTLLRSPDVRTVILVVNFDSGRYRNNALIRRGFAETIFRLQRAGKRVAIVFPNPAYPVSVPTAAAQAAAYGRNREAGVPSDLYRRRNRETLAFLEHVGGSDVVRIRTDRLLCRQRYCATRAGRDVIVRDTGHLTLEGVRFLIPVYEPLFTADPEASTSRPAPADRG